MENDLSEQLRNIALRMYQTGNVQMIADAKVIGGIAAQTLDDNDNELQAMRTIQKSFMKRQVPTLRDQWAMNKYCALFNFKTHQGSNSFDQELALRLAYKLADQAMAISMETGK